MSVDNHPMPTSITQSLLKDLRLDHTRCKNRLKRAKTEDQKNQARVAFNIAKARQNAARAAFQGENSLEELQEANGDGSSLSLQPGSPGNNVIPTETNHDPLFDNHLHDHTVSALYYPQISRASPSTISSPTTVTPPATPAPPPRPDRKRKLPSPSFGASTSMQTPRRTRLRIALEQAENQVIFPNVVTVGSEGGGSIDFEIPKVGDWMRDWKALHASASSVTAGSTSRIKLHQTIEDLGWDLTENSREKTLIHVVRSYSAATSASNTDQDQERALAAIGFDMDSIIEWEAPQSNKRPVVCSFKQAFERDPTGQVQRLKCLGIKCLDEGGEATKIVERLRQSLGCEPSLDNVRIWGTTGTTPQGSLFHLNKQPTSSSDRQQQRRGRLLHAIDNLWKGDPSSDWASVFTRTPSATSAELANMYQSTMRWAIVNGKGTYSDWHQDAGGTLTFFLVKTGRKLWMVKEPETGAVQAVVLEAGDAV